MKEEGSTVEYRLPNEYNRWVKLLYCVSMTAFKRRGSAHGKPVRSPDPNDTNLVSGYLRSTTRGQKMTGHVYAVMNPWTFLRDRRFPTKTE